MATCDITLREQSCEMRTYVEHTPWNTPQHVERATLTRAGWQMGRGDPQRGRPLPALPGRHLAHPPRRLRELVASPLSRPSARVPPQAVGGPDQGPWLRRRQRHGARASTTC